MRRGPDGVGLRTRRARTGITLTAVLGGSVLAWQMTAPAPSDATRGVAPVAGASQVHPRSVALAALRRTMDTAAVDAFVAEQRARATAGSDAAEWRVLAEAHLECVLLASSRLGMAVGRPTFAPVPAEVAAHLAAGEAAVAKARELGDPHSDVARIEAGLLGNRIIGALTAMHLGRRVDALVDEALARDAGNPHALVARGCRLVFAPGWLGGDPARARELFEAAAAGLPDDERPLVFAAFAAHVGGDRAGAQTLLRAASTRNPRNLYATEVLRRLQADEADPFARDLAR